MRLTASGVVPVVQRPRRASSWTRETLPAWPLALPFAGYAGAWFLGLGDIIWPLGAVVMALVLARTTDVRVPPHFGIWLLFLCWVTASAINLDSGARLIGFTYRLSLYLAATVMAVYAYNATRTVTLRYLGGLMTVFLATMTVFGWFALGFPLATVRTPLAWVLPAWLQANELVGDMTVRRLTQFNPGGAEETFPRPSAPFLYANTWGNVYSLVMPWVAAYAYQARGSVSGRWAQVVLLASLVPAALTLNRGMFLGLGVVVVVVVWFLLLQGRPRAAVAALLATALAIVVGWVSPAGQRLLARLDQSSTTADRWELYRATGSQALQSPLLGFGAPRPSVDPYLPSLGTQGQLWTVVFSHGFVAVVLFLAWFAVCVLVGLRSRHLEGAVLTGIVAATLVESLFYGMMTGLMISLIASCLIVRPDDPTVLGQGRREVRQAPGP